jgi:carbonic anhydrase
MTSNGPGTSNISVLDEILGANKLYADGFDRPMHLGVTRKLSIVTCMDSRLLLDKMIPGLDIGDAEIIRNAGGRVTPDVVRSLFVAQEVPELSTSAVVIIHHTDCGGQAVMRHHDMLVGRMQQLISEWNWLIGAVQGFIAACSSLLVPRVIRKKLLNSVMRPFGNPIESVREDVWILRNAPLMPKHIPIYGLMYDVMTGKLHHVTTSPAQK